MVAWEKISCKIRLQRWFPIQLGIYWKTPNLGSDKKENIIQEIFAADFGNKQFSDFHNKNQYQFQIVNSFFYWFNVCTFDVHPHKEIILLLWSVLAFLALLLVILVISCVFLRILLASWRTLLPGAIYSVILELFLTFDYLIKISNFIISIVIVESIDNIFIIVIIVFLVFFFLCFILSFLIFLNIKITEIIFFVSFKS